MSVVLKEVSAYFYQIYIQNIQLVILKIIMISVFKKEIEKKKEH